MEKPSFVDIFATPGGLSEGFEMAGFEALAVIDNDKYGLKTYARNFPKAIVIESDVQCVRDEKLKSILTIGKPIEVAVGGPPCQGFSVIGRVKRASLFRRQGKPRVNTSPRFVEDPRNMLYKEFVRIVNVVRPKFFVMENVVGLVSYKNGSVLEEILEDFAGIGFKSDFRILDSAEFGVPQRRKRIFIVGNRLGLKNPFPRTKTPVRRHIKRSKKRWESAGNAIGDLPRILAGHGTEISHYERKPMTKYQRWARRGSKILYNHVARWHNEKDIQLFKCIKQGEKWEDLPRKIKEMYGYRDDIFLDKMKRLNSNEPAWTIVSHLAKDGYLYIHPRQNRTITVREAARLQSFPDRFVFEGPRTSQFHQVGRAVPPLLAKAVALGLRKELQRTSRNPY